MACRQILYTSQALLPMSSEDCRDLLAEARENNLRDGLTGILIFVSNGTFMQVLEGAGDNLQRTMQRISQDARHAHLGIILDIEVEARSFGEWSMAFRSCNPDDLTNCTGFRNTSNEDEFCRLLEHGPKIMSVMRQLYFANSGLLAV